MCHIILYGEMKSKCKMLQYTNIFFPSPFFVIFPTVPNFLIFNERNIHFCWKFNISNMNFYFKRSNNRNSCMNTAFQRLIMVNKNKKERTWKKNPKRLSYRYVILWTYGCIHVYMHMYGDRKIYEIFELRTLYHILHSCSMMFRIYGIA